MTYLLSADVARRLKVTPETVRYLARTGKLKTATTTERGVRLFSERDVQELLERRASKTAANLEDLFGKEPSQC
jgi:DNA-binding transcriptional MerR regulator